MLGSFAPTIAGDGTAESTDAPDSERSRFGDARDGRCGVERETLINHVVLRVIVEAKFTRCVGIVV